MKQASNRWLHYLMITTLCVLLSLNTVVWAEETTEEPPLEPVSEVTEEPTEVPTATPEPTIEVTDEPETPTPTAEPETEVTPTEAPTTEPEIAPEPPLSLLLAGDFSGDMAGWQVGLGWFIADGVAQVTEGSAPLLWLTPPVYNGAVAALVQGTEGSAQVSLRVTGVTAYTLDFNPAGVVSLRRAGDVVASAAIAPTTAADQWRVVRLSVIGDVVRVMVDGVEVVVWVDDAPLPPGQVALSGTAGWRFAQVSLHVPADELALYPTPEPTEEPEATATEITVTEEADDEDTAPPQTIFALAGPELRLPADGATIFQLRPRLEWRRVQGARGYRVTLADNPGFANPILHEHQVGGVALPLNRRNMDDELRQGTYYWRVEAVDVNGEWGAPSSTSSFTVGLQRTPRFNTFTTNNRIPLNWTRSVDALRYRLLVADNPAFTNPLVLWETDHNRHTGYRPTRDNPLPIGNLFWRVDVEYEGTGWLISPVVFPLTVTPRPLNPPSPLTPAHNSFTNDTTPTFSWTEVIDPSSQPVSYHLQIATRANFRDLLVDEVVTSTDFTLPFALTNAHEGRLFWRVATLNYLGAPGRWSRRMHFTFDITPPNPPLLRTPRDGSATNVARPTLRWRAEPGAVNYELRWGTDNPPASSPIIDNARRVAYRLDGPLLATTYYWQVRATDAAGNTSGWSAPFSLIINSPNNAVPVLNRYTSPTPTLTWTPISWATGYQLQIATDSGFSAIAYSTTIQQGETLFHTLNNPLPQGVYYWRIRARSAPATWGNWSTTGTFLILN